MHLLLKQTFHVHFACKIKWVASDRLIFISNIRHVQIMDCVRTINNCSLYLYIPYPRRNESVTFQFGSLQGMAVVEKRRKTKPYTKLFTRMAKNAITSVRLIGL